MLIWMVQFSHSFTCVRLSGQPGSCGMGKIVSYFNHFFLKDNIDGLGQDCSNSIANALELLQYCFKPSICCLRYLDYELLKPLWDGCQVMCIGALIPYSSWQAITLQAPWWGINNASPGGNICWKLMYSLQSSVVILSNIISCYYDISLLSFFIMICLYYQLLL